MLRSGTAHRECWVAARTSRESSERIENKGVGHAELFDESRGIANKLTRYGLRGAALSPPIFQRAHSAPA